MAFNDSFRQICLSWGLNCDINVLTGSSRRSYRCDVTKTTRIIFQTVSQSRMFSVTTTKLMMRLLSAAPLKLRRFAHTSWRIRVGSLFAVSQRAARHATFCPLPTRMWIEALNSSQLEGASHEPLILDSDSYKLIGCKSPRILGDLGCRNFTP